ncbi:MAG: thioredoxin domain-containing protein, partial [Maribacter sp.]
VGVLKEDTYAYANWASLLTHIVYPYYEVAIVGKDAGKLLADLSRKNIPNTLLVGSTSSSDLALFKDRFFEDGTYIYVCQDNACKLPVKSVKEALQLLEPNQKDDLVPFGLGALE